jgi:glycogenin
MEPPALPTQRPRPIFPWEGHQPPPTRVFIGETALPTPFDSTSEPGEREASIDSRARAETSTTESVTTVQKSEPATPTTPTIRIMQSAPWTAFTRTNAWDEVPEIERYVEGLQKHRRGRSLVLAGIPSGHRTAEGLEQTWGHRSMKLTDFPSEVERPSLPVTPAPIRRPKFWSGGRPGVDDGGGDGEQLLPAAEGVPAQSDWVCVHGNWWGPADCLCDLTNVLRYHKDPVAQLQKLARQQSEALLRKLGGEGDGATSELPTRALPFGSEGVTSPAYVAHSSGGVVLSPRPVKGDTTSMVRSMGEEISVPPGARGLDEPSTVIPEPAYSGPGLAWEKGEGVALTETTPALPTEEEMDVLET